MATSSRRTQTRALLGGHSGRHPGAQHVADGKDQPNQPVDLAVAYEHRQGEQSEEEDQPNLDSVGAHEIVTDTEHEPGQQEDSHSGLDEAAIHADPEEDQELKERGSVCKALECALEPTLRANEDDHQHDHHDGADRSPHEVLVQVDGDLGAENGTDDSRQPEPEDAA